MMALLMAVGCGGDPPAPTVEAVEAVVPKPGLAAAPGAIDVARVLVRAVGDLEGVQPVTVDATRGFGGVLRGEFDGMLALRHPTEAEQRDAAGRDLVPDAPLVSTVLAQDVIAVVVPDGGDVYSVDRASLAAALQGDGAGLGSPGPLSVFGPPRESSVWTVLGRELDLPEGALTEVQVVGTASEVVRLVRTTPRSLGITSRTAVVGVRPLAITDEGGTHTLDDDWPLRRELVLVTRGAPDRFAPLLEFAGSPAGLMSFQQEGFSTP